MSATAGRNEDTMIIDSHQHVFWYGRDDAGLIADMDQQGIDRAWLLSWEMAPQEDNGDYHHALNPLHFRADGTHAGIPLADLLLARAHYPKRFVVGYCPHPGKGAAAAAFEAAYRMHGVRICGEWKFHMLLDDPRCLELFGKAGELGCPVVLHLDVPYLMDNGKPKYQPLWFGGTVANLERALRACPGTNFVGHAPGFWREISGDADADPAAYPQGPVQVGGRLHELLDKYGNLYADLSAGSGLGALKRDPEHARKFLLRYAERLLFGRDFYGDDLQVFLRTLNLPGDVAEKIYQGNARKLVKSE
ncbi:MAG: amidohydrolase family protein [Phycisphaeraceae bacterium]|nr:amidohydrolase family protein [Phycisphaeraceae bacterium]